MISRSRRNWSFPSWVVGSAVDSCLRPAYQKNLPFAHLAPSHWSIHSKWPLVLTDRWVGVPAATLPLHAIDRLNFQTWPGCRNKPASSLGGSPNGLIGSTTGVAIELSCLLVAKTTILGPSGSSLFCQLNRNRWKLDISPTGWTGTDLV